MIKIKTLLFASNRTSNNLLFTGGGLKYGILSGRMEFDNLNIFLIYSLINLLWDPT